MPRYRRGRGRHHNRSPKPIYVPRPGSERPPPPQRPPSYPSRGPVRYPRRKGPSAPKQLVAWVTIALVITIGVIAFLYWGGDEEPQATAAATPSPSLESTPMLDVVTQDQATVVPTTTTGSAASTSVTTTSSPTPPSMPTPVLHPVERHMEAKLYMLDLVNAERANAGSGAVVLGDNIAAQLHAEAALAGCHSSHWGGDGLQPYMRYSLAGGYNSNGENGSGLDYCIKASDGYRALDPINDEVRTEVAGWMRSPGHRDNMLDPWHRKLNIGIAYDRYNVMMFQHFEGDYVVYEQLPTIESGRLIIKGRTINGATQRRTRDMAVSILYDPPPRQLTRGQLTRTYCYDAGLPVASLREPLTGDSYYPDNSYKDTYDPCPDPYDVDPDSPGPSNADQAHRFWQEAYNASNSTVPQDVTALWITADRWNVNGDNFEIRAPLGKVLSRHGPGVYTVMIWGVVNGEDNVLSHYSIFWEITPPGTYQQVSN